MKKLGLIFLLISSCLTGSCQTKNIGFLDFAKGLQNLNVPLTSSKIVGEVEFNETAKRLSLEEWKYLGMDNKAWPFQKDYSYEIFGRINLKNSLIGVIYRRSYLPSDITKEKREIVLATFTKEGKLVSSLPIQGAYGDDINFFGSINQKFEIAINYEIYSLNKETRKSQVRKKSEKYRIKDSGEIEKYS